MIIDFDQKKAASNLHKHGVSFDEATTSLLDPQALLREDPDARGGVRFSVAGYESCGTVINGVLYLAG